MVNNSLVMLRRGRVLHLLSVPWLLLLVWLTSVAWFLTDDAFISFRYVRNLLEGHGLVFNPGEYVEGYTNFLWILELAALWGLFGVRPEHAAPWLSVAYTGGTLAALWWWLARSPTRHDRGFLAWLALGLLCSSATFAVWTAGGRTGNAAVHLLCCCGGGLPGGASPPALGPAGGLLEPGGGRPDTARRAAAGRLLFGLVHLPTPANDPVVSGAG